MKAIKGVAKILILSNGTSIYQNRAWTLPSQFTTNATSVLHYLAPSRVFASLLPFDARKNLLLKKTQTRSSSEEHFHTPFRELGDETESMHIRCFSIALEDEQNTLSNFLKGSLQVVDWCEDEFLQNRGTDDFMDPLLLMWPEFSSLENSHPHRAYSPGTIPRHLESLISRHP
jgi:hypothetical protein